MGIKKDIKDIVTQLLASEDYKIQEADSIPGPGDNRLTFGNTGVRFDAVVLYIDMRGSTAVLNSHRPQSVAKIHKAYLFITTKLIAENGGQIRSYNGDSILAFFPGKSKQSITKAIITAGKIRFMLVNECGSDFAKYRPVDFGIGIDLGQVLCVKTGTGKNENHNDLIWLGNAVNRATKLSDNAKSPNHVWVSQGIRDMMEDTTRFHPQTRQDLWSQTTAKYNETNEIAWMTQIGWTVE